MTRKRKHNDKWFFFFFLASTQLLISNELKIERNVLISHRGIQKLKAKHICLPDDNGNVASRRQFALSMCSKLQWKCLTRIGLKKHTHTHIETKQKFRKIHVIFILGAEFSQIASGFGQSLLLRLHINLTIVKNCIFFACALE